MPRNYEYVEINMEDLLLDDENPRFASSMLVKGSNSSISQKAIIEHLLKYADIIKLANRINEVEELHGSEVITCYKRGKKYIVLEGNRRTCACKLLLDRKLIPDEYKSNFPFVKDTTKENIERVMVIVYPDRQSVQAFLSDRHISGVKKWSALEKNNYYMNLFDAYKDVNEVKKYTSDTLNIIVKSIKKYQFFMNVFYLLKTEHANIEIEKLDYLPMVDRFMETLVGNDAEVGLNLNLDEKNLIYMYDEDKKDIYEAILLSVGEAFLIRKENKFCNENELSKIVASEIYGFASQKKLILEDNRIPGLINLINLYKGIYEKDDMPSTNKVTQQEGGGYSNCGKENGDNTTQKGSNSDVNDEGKGSESESQGKSNGDDADLDNNENDVYMPPVKYKPKKTKTEYLHFYQDEAKNFKINTENNYDEKIRSILFDLNSFSVYKHPYTVALLYRTLLEICTKRVYHAASSRINKEHNENDLAQSMLYLTNNFLFNNKRGKDFPKIKETIKTYLSSTNLIQILNLYIHYSDPVDENIILSSWSSMKKYIQYCLEI